MITIKILLIALVVITTIHQALTPPLTYLIHDTRLFSGSGQVVGIHKFKFAYKNISVHKINHIINAIFEENNDTVTKILQKRVTFGYFLHLHRAIYDDHSDIDFNFPEHWCPFKVEQMRHSGTLYKHFTPESQAATCLEYITTQLIKREVYYIQNVGYRENAKGIILDELYKNWTHDAINVIIEYNSSLPDPLLQMPGVLTFAYTLGYFDYVGDYVKSLTHDPKYYKSVNKYCIDEGNGLIG